MKPNPVWRSPLRAPALIVACLLALPPAAFAQDEDGEELSEAEKLMQAEREAAIQRQGGKKADAPEAGEENPVVPAEDGEGVTALQMTMTPEEAAADTDFASFECPGDFDLGTHYVICAVANDEGIVRSQMFPERTAVVLPNRSFLVKVLHPKSRRIGVAVEGKKGIYRPQLRTDMHRGEEEDGARGALPPGTMVSQTLIPPLLPSDDDTRITVRLLAGTEELDAIPFEMIVEPTYMGALRIGIAAVGMGAVDAEYSVMRTAGAQGQIVGLPPAMANFELVLGYAPYLERGGRPVSGCRGGLSCFAPYIGLGVLAQGAEGLDFFESLHAGIEWEPSPSFSIATTFVARRVDRLQAGLKVGGPAPANPGDLTAQRVAFGAGVVINVTPQFLKVAARGGSGLF